jgi:hypothetical protein
MLIPANIKAKLEEMAEKIDYDLCFSSFNSGASALWTLLMEGAGEFDVRESQQEFDRYEKGLFCVDSWHRSARWQHSQLTPVIQALKAENKMILALNKQYVDEIMNRSLAFQEALNEIARLKAVVEEIQYYRKGDE